MSTETFGRMIIFCLYARLAERQDVWTLEQTLKTLNRSIN